MAAQENKDDVSSTELPTSYPKKKINILLLENIAQSAVNYFVNQGYTVETAKHLTDEELIEKLKYIHVIGIRSKTKLRKHILKHAKKLLCIGHFCIGTDQTDLDFAQNLGIPVFNSPFANTRSVAELVLANSIILSRKAGDQNRWMHDGLWKKTAVGCHEVRGKTMGIIGYGHVGSQLSILAESLGFKVIYYDIIPKLPLGLAKSMDTMDDLLANADFVTLHVPYTKLTHNMIGKEQLSKMKKGSYLLNAARGKCVVIEDVAESLKSGHLAGAYFDVYPSEPTNKELVLCDCPNTILTPHIGGATEEAQTNIGIEVAEKVTNFINGGLTVGAVNFPEVMLQPNDKVHRILHVHRNVAGVLNKINDILKEYNVTAQVLQTTKDIGYLLVEIESDKTLSSEVKKQMNSLAESIRTRLLFSPGL